MDSLERRGSIQSKVLREPLSMYSSPAEATTESAPPPEPEDRMPEDPVGDSWWKKSPRIVLVVAVIALVAGAFLLARISRKLPSSAGAPQSSNAPNGPAGILRLKGTTAAVQTRVILAPMLAGQQFSSLTITKLAPGGSRVKRGDLLVEFDRQAQVRDSIDKQADLSKLAAQVAEEQAKEIAERAKDETEIKQAEDDLSKAELEMQKVELFSRIDAEKAQETLDQARATLQQLRETYDLKRKAKQAAIRILEIQRDRTRETMLHAQANAELMQIRSPTDGIAVLNTIWKERGPGEAQEGDQIRPGQPFMQVVDPSVMEVHVPVNQEDFLQLQIGQTANVHLDAYPDLVFPGKLEEMALIGREGDFSNKVRTFVVVFSISGNDPKLMPDLSAAVDVDLSGHASSVGGSQ
jgi:multidrug efflux pump subunit AcrA (membrane-fusion protein)